MCNFLISSSRPTLRDTSEYIYILDHNKGAQVGPLHEILLGTVLEELFAGLLLQPLGTLSHHGLLHLRHVVL